MVEGEPTQVYSHHDSLPALRSLSASPRLYTPPRSSSKAFLKLNVPNKDFGTFLDILVWYTNDSFSFINLFPPFGRISVDIIELPPPPKKINLAYVILTSYESGRNSKTRQKSLIFKAYLIMF